MAAIKVAINRRIHPKIPDFLLEELNTDQERQYGSDKDTVNLTYEESDWWDWCGIRLIINHEHDEKNRLQQQKLDKKYIRLVLGKIKLFNIMIIHLN